ncbi:hypothetical protein D3C87_1128020 [compost metagenome]
MLKRLIEQLVEEATKKPEAKAPLPGRHFVTVSRHGNRFQLHVTSSVRLDWQVVEHVKAAAGWQDWRTEDVSFGVAYSGIPRASLVDSKKPGTWRLVTHDDLKELHAVRSREGLSHDDVKALIKNIWGHESTTSLNVAQLRELIDVILPQGRTTIAARNWYRKGA